MNNNMGVYITMYVFAEAMITGLAWFNKLETFFILLLQLVWLAMRRRL